MRKTENREQVTLVFSIQMFNPTQQQSLRVLSKKSEVQDVYFNAILKLWEFI